MLFYNFKNYEEFKEIFGIIEHGNGVKSRKNKILLALYKDRKQFKFHVRCMELRSLSEQYMHWTKKKNNIEDGASSDKHYKAYCERRQQVRLRIRKFADRDFSQEDVLVYKSLPTLKTFLYNALEGTDYFTGNRARYIRIMGHMFFSDSYETDDMDGLCEDGTLNAIRYKNIEKDRVFKMKAGKMFNHLMSCNRILSHMPEQIQRWLSEEFVGEWIEYARSKVGNAGMTLHVDDNFADIYSRERCAGYDTDGDSFGSCMVGDGQWTFYRDAVKAKAAYLTDNETGLITARCIVFTDVTDQDGNKYRLAERQYSKSCDPSLQRQLVCALIRGGYIDGYKKVGASCHSPREFVDCCGNSLEGKKFEIECKLEKGGTLSYQDSFKWYDLENHVADNHEFGRYDLSVTAPKFHCECDDDGDHEFERWSEFNGEWINEDDAYYVDTRDDYFFGYQVNCAYVYIGNGRWSEEDCFEGDCIEIGGSYYYAGIDAESPGSNGISYCPECDCYFVKEREDAEYSDVTGDWYCCPDCRTEAEERWYLENGYAQSELGKWYPKDEIIEADEWTYTYVKGIGFCYAFKKIHISIDEFNSLVECARATEYCGKYYIDGLNSEGEPVHLHTLHNKVA